ncbi:hypothetical protein CMV_027237 [Castanea mollissima]|uniref:Ion transport domain-containing protein n=1 Tax=Castanea mollissima TaxID=60419 RepID=A0A8J4QIL3_9ROSI|nr:hypothetical protein CMV_027237 [Castanea mollissima]
MSFRGNRREEGDSCRIREMEVIESGDLSPRSRISMKIRELRPSFFQSWRIIFGVSCVIAVALDPLFFYVPVINEDNKCIGLDKKLRTISLILRSVTDIIGIINIILQVLSGYTGKTSGEDIGPKKIPWRRRLYFLIDILVLLPFPQVIILIIFRELKGSKSLKKRKLLNFFVLFQYAPRVVQLYRTWKDPDRKVSSNKTPIWVKAAFNFFLYIVASHVLGAFWYLLSIERETACWHKACEKNNECSDSSFNCDHILGNHTFLNVDCIISPPNATPNTTFFDFGIFLGALQSGVVQSHTATRQHQISGSDQRKRTGTTAATVMEALMRLSGGRVRLG